VGIPDASAVAGALAKALVGALAGAEAFADSSADGGVALEPGPPHAASSAIAAKSVAAVRRVSPRTTP
jgi:hypothetical protein